MGRPVNHPERKHFLCGRQLYVIREMSLSVSTVWLGPSKFDLSSKHHMSAFQEAYIQNNLYFILYFHSTARFYNGSKLKFQGSTNSNQCKDSKVKLSRHDRDCRFWPSDQQLAKYNTTFKWFDPNQMFSFLLKYLC